MNDVFRYWFDRDHIEERMEVDFMPLCSPLAEQAIIGALIEMGEGARSVLAEERITGRFLRMYDHREAFKATLLMCEEDSADKMRAMEFSLGYPRGLIDCMKYSSAWWEFTQDMCGIRFTSWDNHGELYEYVVLGGMRKSGEFLSETGRLVKKLYEIRMGQEQANRRVDTLLKEMG